MNFITRRIIVLALLAVSIGLLIPGLISPVLTIQGELKPEGVAQMVPGMLDKGLSDDTIKTLKSLMNPTIVSLIESTGSDLRTVLVQRLGPQIAASLKQNAVNVEVFLQSRSIAGTVKHLYQVNSPLPATLILLFSVIVPFSKALLVGAAMFVRDAALRRRMLGFVEIIAKWSMADVFVVALFIAYLAAEATQSSSGPSSLVVFTATFGPGFYWFLSYCLFSLATQQFTSRWFAKDRGEVSSVPMAT
jgi:hypothetical protein